jgi:4-hydroxybenzoate polyprenyltransferase
VSLGTAYWLRPAFCGAVVFYLLLMLTYTLALKKVMFVDVLVIAIGFVFRAIAGAIVLGVNFSNWLAVCTLFLALFLGLGKRRCEIEVLEGAAAAHRDVLRSYTVHHLDSLLTIMAACTLLTYTIYTCSPEVVSRLGTDKLYVTLPFVVYGLFRYLHLIHHKNGGGDPSRTLLKDAPLALTVGLWGVACTVIIYFYGGMRQ